MTLSVSKTIEVCTPIGLMKVQLVILPRDCQYHTRANSPELEAAVYRMFVSFREEKELLALAGDVSWLLCRKALIHQAGKWHTEHLAARSLISWEPIGGGRWLLSFRPTVPAL